MPRNLERGGGAIFCLHVSTENIGEDQKKGVQVLRRPIYPPKSSEDQKKGQRVLRCPVSTVSLTADIYQVIFQRWGSHNPSAPPPPLDTPLTYTVYVYNNKSLIFRLYIY